MTQYRRKVEAHVEERWVDGKTLCDFCHRDVDRVNQGNMTEIELNANIGDRWAEEDSRTGYRLDCCEECFMDKVKPVLQALGAEWQEYSEWSGDSLVDDVQNEDGKYMSELEEVV